MYGISLVYVDPAGTFDNNGYSGVGIGDTSTLVMVGFGGIDISNNVNAGVSASGGLFQSYGGVTISSNTAIPNAGSVSGFGVDVRGGGRVQFGALFGPNIIQNNQAGGVSLQEVAEASFWGGNYVNGYPNILQNNGPVGVVVSYGSQATFYDSAQILNHTEVGVDVYGNSQAYFNLSNTLQGNGTNTNFTERAGLRVDGNSEAYLRGAKFLQNGGPAILNLVNSSVDFAGLTFTQNSGGKVFCDSTSYMLTDLPKSQQNPAHGVACETPHSMGNHRSYAMSAPHMPDLSKLKAKHDYHVNLSRQH